MKNLSFILFFVFFFMATTTMCLAQEQITITTYYPAPVGVYTELRATRIAIGDNYFNPSVNRWGTEISSSADLVVEGDVGIGTLTPGNRLEVRGGNINFPVNALGFNSGTTGGTAGIAISDAGWIYGEHNSGTEVSRFVFELQDNADESFRFRTRPHDWNNPMEDIVTIIANGNVGLGTTSPNALLDVRADTAQGYSTNLCVWVPYTSNSGARDCPTGYMFMFSSSTAPAPPWYFMCCQACKDGTLATNPNGVCNT